MKKRSFNNVSTRQKKSQEEKPLCRSIESESYCIRLFLYSCSLFTVQGADSMNLCSKLINYVSIYIARIESKNDRNGNEERAWERVRGKSKRHTYRQLKLKIACSR